MRHVQKVPKSTYRLQINKSFTLLSATKIIDYLADLGVDWLYLSPLLEAQVDSNHGYDVVNPDQIDRARGGAEGLQLLSDLAHQRDMGILVDIVPNHMGIATPKANAWWWDVLKYGRDSRYAIAFDIDWSAGSAKIRIPVLDDQDNAEFTIQTDDKGSGELHYQNNRYPLAPGTADDTIDPREIHDRQHYELIPWRDANSLLNYRRFFAINTLAAIRPEVRWVFEESHREIVRWVREHLVDGLRIDHPDGLADPTGYLDRLNTATNGAYVVVEKILQKNEQLPTFWACQGTTGYDALVQIDRLFVDPCGEIPLEQLDVELRDDTTALQWSDLIHETKRTVADGMLRAEVLRLARECSEILNWSIAVLSDALAELLACFGTYRSYLPFGRQYLNFAAKDAKSRRPDLQSVIDDVVRLLGDPSQPSAIRFQQTSGMVMAKGVEDTAFYRYSRLTSLTEVGGDPSEFSIDVTDFHHLQSIRHSTFPFSQTALSTHDTKRGEDTRARINVLAEIPYRWKEFILEMCRRVRFADGAFENLVWQSIVGIWPATRIRIQAFALKAAREANTQTSWITPNENFERQLRVGIDLIFDDPEIKALVDEFTTEIQAHGWSNSLSAKVVQLLAPGVPDVYQGSELWEFYLVDPDNRGNVNFDIGAHLLHEINAGLKPSIDETGAAKLLVTCKSLRLRRDYPQYFNRYVPLTAVGHASSNVIAFDRGGAIAIVTRLPITLNRKGGWRDTQILLPTGQYIDHFTDVVHDGGALNLESVLSKYPVALLTKNDKDG